MSERNPDRPPAELTADDLEELWHLCCANLAERRVLALRFAREGLLPRPGELEDIERISALTHTVYTLLLEGPRRARG